MKKLFLYRFFGGLLFFPGCLPSAWSAEDPDDVISIRVTGTHLPESRGPRTRLFHLDREQIEARQATSTIGLLRGVPGVDVTQMGGEGGLTFVSIRGGEPNFTAFVVDGVLMNDPTNTRGGAFDLSFIDPQSIEKIEVFAGAGSAVWGSDALAGVINITTRRGYGENKVKAYAGVGSSDAYEAGLSFYGAPAGAVSNWSLSANYRDSGDPVEGDNLQARIDFIPRWLIRLPDVTYSREEFWAIAQYFLVIYAVLFLLGQLIAGVWRISDSRRTVDELFIIATGFATTALIVFVTTSVSFDPQLFIGVTVSAAVMVLVIHVIALIATGARHGGLLTFIKALFSRVFSIPGILVLALAVSPGILAKLFVSDRDVANAITRVRMAFSLDEDYQWVLVNALSGEKFAQPILVQFPPNQNDELFVLERRGVIKRLAWPVKGSPETVLDVSDLVGFVEVENGALGFDFHPDFGKKGDANEHAIYLYYTSVHDGEQVNYLSRFDLGGETPESRKGSEQQLISWDRPEDGFHNGGSVEFGPDGFLYIALGEMATRSSHQKIDESMISGILRIDVDQRGGTVSHPIKRQPVNGTSAGYFIPSDNPFVGEADALEEFWATGLRNPFRISFDPQTGKLWTGDVGSTVWEEVNVVQKGHNYEFPYIEGREATGIAKPPKISGVESGPVYTYRHTAYDRAVIGGVVYRGSRLSELQGQYVFGDNYSGMIFAFPSDKARVDKVANLGKAPQVAQRGITSFTQTPDGEILITAMGKATGATGVVYRLAKADEEGLDDGPSESLESQSRPVTSDEAAELYRVSCSRCHGNEGKGDGPDGPHMGVPMPDLTAPASLKSRDDIALRQVILEGGPAVGMSPMMPPWKGILNEQEVDGIVRYIKGL